MFMGERLYCHKNETSGGFYNVYKATGEFIKVLLEEVKAKDKRQICCEVRYKNIGVEYQSPFLSWYNLFFCSNYYGPPPDYEYMNKAVQQNTKTAATVYAGIDSETGKEIVKSIPDNCAVLPYDNSMIFVFHRGTLSNFFNIEEIKMMYQKHGILDIDWNTIRHYADKPLEYFASKESNFSIQCCGGKEKLVVNGLLLGYPVESTIAYINNTII